MRKTLQILFKAITLKHKNYILLEKQFVFPLTNQ